MDNITILEYVTSTMTSLFIEVSDPTTEIGIQGKHLTYTEETLSQQLHFVMSAIVGPIVCLFGLVGNVLSVITWCRPNMKSSTGRYLVGQAIADFSVLLLFLLCDSLQAWAPSLKKDIVYGVFFSYIGYPFFFLAIVCSIWFTVGVTVDRYIMVCWITKAKKYCSQTRANFGLALITVNGFLMNFPHFISFAPVYDHEKTDENGTLNMDRNAFEMTEFGGGAGGMFYEFWIHCIILIIIPWVTVFAMNIMIIKTINNSNKKMEDKKTTQAILNSKKSENQITRLLLTVTFTFLFFIGLQCIIQCFFMQEPPWANMEQVSGAFAFAKTGIVFNSSANFLLYCMSGRRFRNELMGMLGMLKKDFHITSLVEHPSTSGTNNTTSTTSNTVI